MSLYTPPDRTELVDRDAPRPMELAPDLQVALAELATVEGHSLNHLIVLLLNEGLDQRLHTRG